MRRAGQLGAAGLGLLLLAAVPAPARADEAQAQAQADRLFDEGLAHYNLGEYPAAIAAFREAYRLVREPLFLFNLGQAHRKANQCVEAIDMYGAFLREADGPTNRDKAEQFMRELEPCAAEQRRARAAAGATPTTGPVAPSGPAQTTRPQRTRRDRGGGVRLAGLAVGAAGVAGLAAGAFYWNRSRALRDDLAEACGSAGCDWTNPDQRAIDAAGRQANTRAWITSLAGAGLVAAGVGLYAWGKTRREWVVVPVAALAEGGGGVVVTGGF
ncbi:MAG: hypothetical protein KBG28_28070 [Kofleriaceae bacterium]|jgi:tetratricopeptide (TPR) repeat protein|nr:hypothetical protein [Kofleriaceae bacterium]MBP6837957.1 hypothetical protein [Kofleriaceae bacterium]MBP9207854.1 hypothetical protein [Kofleriaceae bacterium]